MCQYPLKLHKSGLLSDLLRLLGLLYDRYALAIGRECESLCRKHSKLKDILLLCNLTVGARTCMKTIYGEHQFSENSRCRLHSNGSWQLSTRSCRA